MKNILLALVFLLLMVGAALAVTRTRTAPSVGLNGIPTAEATDQEQNCASKCSMKKQASTKKVCPSMGK